MPTGHLLWTFYMHLKPTSKPFLHIVLVSMDDTTVHSGSQKLEVIWIFLTLPVSNQLASPLIFISGFLTSQIPLFSHPSSLVQSLIVSHLGHIR